MSVKKIIKGFSVGSLMFCIPALSANLVQVYQDALSSDPSFKVAQATWQSAKQALPIAKANLFPTIDLTGGLKRNYQNLKGGGTNGHYNSTNYGLSITEPLFNMANWASIRSADASVKAATATYIAAQQDLIYRTAKAYFAVLQASDELRYTVAQKKAVYQQLETSRQKYKVGLIAITPVYDAQASFDTAIANEISDRNALDNALENLRAITGILYTKMSSLRDQVPLLKPNPKNIDAWVKEALAQNYSLSAQKFQVQASRETVKKNAAARYPTINATGSFTATNNGNYAQVEKANSRTGTIGLALDFPAYQGGLVTATTKQAEYNYLNASSTLEFDHRDVLNQTRQAYLGVIAGISSVQADRQSVISNQNSMKATNAGYTVGTRTMVDVLQALSELYSAQKIYSNDQYTYIINLLTLKKEAGTLGLADLTQINQWLKKTKVFKNHNVNNTTPARPATPVEKQFTQPTKKRSPKPKVQKSAQLSSGYAIQLAASKTLDRANQLASRYRAGRIHPRVIKETINGKTWYKVVIGQYTTKQAANNSISSLPERIRTLRPWAVSTPATSATVTTPTVTAPIKTASMLPLLPTPLA